MKIEGKVVTFCCEDLKKEVLNREVNLFVLRDELNIHWASHRAQYCPFCGKMIEVKEEEAE